MTSKYRLPEEFYTERFGLRRVRSTDAQSIFIGYANDPLVTKYLTWLPHETIEDTYRVIESMQADWENGTGFPLVIFDPDSRAVVGMIHPHIFGSRISYGYVIRIDRWGQGIASEALKHLVEHALGHADIYRAQAFCDAENGASARVMEKAGMLFEGVLRRYSRHPTENAPRDCLMYAAVR